MWEFLSKLPPWVGNVPVWILLVSAFSYVYIQQLKNKPVLEQQKIDDRHKIKDGYINRIQTLEDKLQQNAVQCEADKAELLIKIDSLQRRLTNEILQRGQAEISLVSTLIQVVDAEELKKILTALEAKQIRLLETQKLEGPVNDKLGEQ